ARGPTEGTVEKTLTTQVVQDVGHHIPLSSLRGGQEARAVLHARRDIVDGAVRLGAAEITARGAQKELDRPALKPRWRDARQVTVDRSGRGVGAERCV